MDGRDRRDSEEDEIPAQRFVRVLRLREGVDYRALPAA
jgi:hypothetical protein